MRMVATKNSRKALVACSPASRIRPGRTAKPALASFRELERAIERV